jgi:hypothetical protein
MKEISFIVNFRLIPHHRLRVCSSATELQARNDPDLIQDKAAEILPKIKTIKRHLAKAIVDFMGPEILKEIQRLPAWKNNLNASKESMACKYGRAH